MQGPLLAGLLLTEVGPEETLLSPCAWAFLMLCPNPPGVIAVVTPPAPATPTVVNALGKDIPPEEHIPTTKAVQFKFSFIAASLMAKSGASFESVFGEEISKFLEISFLQEQITIINSSITTLNMQGFLDLDFSRIDFDLVK